ncbi:clotting factor B [Caerostris darwini]|uniref:Clotting factor B n=1 Tax=Caerostris darwini TaxID=1538125 RepID=A0AAV4SAM7_9ARAC|nr:clotting factor B [Caerostris darwini]
METIADVYRGYVTCVLSRKISEMQDCSPPIFIVALTIMECCLFNLNELRTLFTLLCVTILILQASSESNNFKIRTNDDGTTKNYQPVPSTNKLRLAKKNFSSSEVQNGTSFLNEQKNQRGAFYYASSSHARQDNTSVHVFVKSDPSPKRNFGKDVNSVFVNKNGNSCAGQCSEKSAVHSEQEIPFVNSIPKANSKDSNIMNLKKISIASIFDKLSSNANTDHLSNSNDKDLVDVSFQNDSSQSFQYETETPDSLGGILSRSRSSREFNDRDESFEMSFNENASYSESSSERLNGSDSDDQPYFAPSGIQSRSGRLYDDSSENHSTSSRMNGVSRRSGGVSRVPLLPVLPVLEKNTTKESAKERNITDEELREFISQLKQSRAGVIFDEDSNRQECQTSDSSSGTCRPLPECKPVLNSFRTQRPVICRWKNDMPIVCCPNPTLSRRLEVPGCGTRTIRGLNRVARQVPRMIPLDFGAPSHKNNMRPSIAGGEESEVGAWPWMAGIYTRNFGIENFLCGAAIVNERHVVTAAHCFRTRGGGRVVPTRYAVRVGSIKALEGTQHLIDEIIIHPQYLPREYYNDIAVIRLKDPINFESNVRPICLPTSPDMRRKRLQDREVTVTGWGDQDFGGKRATILREVTVKVIDLTVCNKSYEQVGGSSIPRGITRQFICAGVPEGGKDACQRDSGGPLMLLKKSVWILVAWFPWIPVCTC